MVSVRVKIMVFVALMFCLIMVLESGFAQISINSTTTNSNQRISSTNQTRIDLMANPNFTFFNETTGLPSNWNDPVNNCKERFSCTLKFTDGWNDYVSFSLSTTNNANNTWSSVRSDVIAVNPGQQYQLISHMKLNKWATQSHVILEGFNETSNKWYQIKQCPSGINGPLDWQEFNCTVKIPVKTTQIRSVLNAGWSSQPNKEATTWFDAINILTNR